MNWHLIVVDWFIVSSDPSGYVVRELYLPLVGSSKANWSEVRGSSSVAQCYWSLNLEPRLGREFKRENLFAVHNYKPVRLLKKKSFSLILKILFAK